MNRAGYLLMAVVVIFAARAKGAPPTTQNVPGKPPSHSVLAVEGWTVHVDDRLVHGAGKHLGNQAIRLLGHQLANVAMQLPAEKVARLREVKIWLDLTHGGLRSAQYHPSRRWLAANGYDLALEKVVHIPDAMDFVSPRLQREQPWMVLHELAHAYHDQVLGFEQARVKAAWRRFVKSGKYESILHVNGSVTKHYALTNDKEFFAEMSEAYFGVNDFFPFNRAELESEEPELLRLIEEMWGRTQ